MKIEHPTTGTVLTTDSSLPRDAKIGDLSGYDSVKDGVLRMDDRPEAVSKAQWKAFLEGTYEIVAAQNDFEAVWGAHKARISGANTLNREIRQAINDAEKNAFWGAVDGTLDGTGLTVAHDHHIQGGRTRYHKVFHDGQEVGTVALQGQETPESTALKVQLSVGQLPKEAAAFDAKLTPAQRQVVAFLLTQTAVSSRYITASREPLSEKVTTFAMAGESVMLTAADGHGRGGVITLTARDDGQLGVRYQDMMGGRPADFEFDPASIADPEAFQQINPVA